MRQIDPAESKNYGRPHELSGIRDSLKGLKIPALEIANGILAAFCFLHQVHKANKRHLFVCG
jgi:hypothetical protein